MQEGTPAEMAEQENRFMNSKKKPDIDTFKGIVSQHQDRLFRFAFMRVGVRETAEDMVQEVFINLFRTMENGMTISNVEYYLLHSVSNACIDYYRKKKHPMLSLEEIEDIPNDADRDMTEEFNRISNLLDDLPFEQAETVRLKCYDGLTFLQIAELHGIPEATAKSRYRYAIQHIKNRLNNPKTK